VTGIDDNDDDDYDNDYSMLPRSNTGYEVGKLQYFYDCCHMRVLYPYLLVIN